MRVLNSIESPIPTSNTLIAIPVTRLQDEFNSGVKYQQADEHWRKQVRIFGSLGSTALMLILNVLGYGGDASPYLALLINCFLHVML
jgi:hypothetical protein